MDNIGFRITNYDGGLPSHSVPEAKGRLVLTPSGHWELHFAGGIGNSDTSTREGMVRYSFEVTETGQSSCHVTIHHTENPAISAAFDVPLTAAVGLNEVLTDQAQAMGTRERLVKRPNDSPRANAQWWEGIEPHTILSTCHYAGERDTGILAATDAGINYSTRGGAKGHCPWSDVVNIEIAESKTRFGRQRNSTGMGRVDLAVVGTTTLRPRHIVTITDTRGQRFHFVSEDSSQAAMARLVAIIERLRRSLGAPSSSPPASPPARAKQ